MSEIGLRVVILKEVLYDNYVNELKVIFFGLLDKYFVYIENDICVLVCGY